MARVKRDHTVLPATRTFIHESNEPSCLYSVSIHQMVKWSPIISCRSSVGHGKFASHRYHCATQPTNRAFYRWREVSWSLASPFSTNSRLLVTAGRLLYFHFFRLTESSSDGDKISMTWHLTNRSTIFLNFGASSITSLARIIALRLARGRPGGLNKLDKRQRTEVTRILNCLGLEIA